MIAGRAETIAFLGPGLLHHLGNVLFTIQGNAAVRGWGDHERERLAIAGAAERGGGTLRVLRFLLGDPATGPMPAAELLQQVAELVRVPVREAQQALELVVADDRPSPHVDASEFVCLAIEAVRQLLALVPDGTRGTVVLGLGTADRQAVLRVGFRPPAGALPFPLAVADFVHGIELEVARSRHRPVVRAHGTGLEIAFAARPASQIAEA